MGLKSLLTSRKSWLIVAAVVLVVAAAGGGYIYLQQKEEKQNNDSEETVPASAGSTGLGDLCSSEEDCQTYCSEHSDECIAYCQEHADDEFCTEHAEDVSAEIPGIPGKCEGSDCETYCSTHGEECHQYCQENPDAAICQMDSGDGSPGAGTVTGENVDWSGAYTYTDPAGDFWMGEGSPPSLINFPPSDVTKFYFKNDDQYLYLKFEVAGEIPTLPLEHSGDTVRILTMSCVIDTDRNKSTGAVMNFTGGDIAMDLFFGSPPEAEGQFYTFANHFIYDASAEEGSKDAGNGTFLTGGAGESFVTVKFALSELGLQKGMVVDILPWVEAESNLYHHFARDEIAGGQWCTGVEIK